MINALSVDRSFEAAVDCICTILRDTREVDESIEVIQLIYPRLVALRPKIAKAADSADQDTYKGYTRLFAEAGEHWVVMIARLPIEFRGLVECVLECCARDSDREAISLTFLFWYEFKQMITLEKYATARKSFENVFTNLVDVMIKHLQFPTPEGSDESDLFDGDREQEEKFREFRHQMGDVLKDCCEVITVTECLGKAFVLIQQWISSYGSQATDNQVPHWQELEAPLFAMRAMGRMVSPEENIVLHQVIPLMVQIPNHEKLRFQAIMALGRYTEWTAQHPDYLQPQLNLIMAGFKHESKEVVKAAALAFRFFGTDCRKLLADHAMQLHGFYESVLDGLPTVSQEEITEGVACVVSAQPLDQIYPLFKMYCDPIIKRMMARAETARSTEDEPGRLAVAGMYLVHMYPDSITDRTFARLSSAYYNLHTAYPTLRISLGRESSGQVLPGDFASHVRHRRKFYQLCANTGASLPLLAVHGTLLQNSNSSPTAEASPATSQRLRKLQTRLLPLGHRLRPPRIRQWRRIRRRDNLPTHLQLLRATSPRLPPDHERPPTQPAPRRHRRLLPSPHRRPNLLPLQPPSRPNMLPHPLRRHQRSDPRARTAPDSHSALPPRLPKLRYRPSQFLEFRRRRRRPTSLCPAGNHGPAPASLRQAPRRRPRRSPHPAYRDRHDVLLPARLLPRRQRRDAHPLRNHAAADGYVDQGHRGHVTGGDGQAGRGGAPDAGDRDEVAAGGGAQGEGAVAGFHEWVSQEACCAQGGVGQIRGYEIPVYWVVREGWWVCWVIGGILIL